MLLVSAFPIPNSAFHLFSDMLKPNFQQPRHMFIIQGIIYHLAIPAAFYQGQVFQSTELMGYGRLTQSGKGRQITHAHLTASQHHDDFKPVGISQYFLGERQSLQFAFRYNFLTSSLHPVQVHNPHPAAVFFKKFGPWSSHKTSWIYESLFIY